MRGLVDKTIITVLYGTLCLLEFHYYMNLYFYRSRQLFVSESELEGLKSSAQTAFSHAEDWAGVLENISSYAEAIVNLSDPEGTIFNFTFGEPLNLLPVVPGNSSGFILASNFTLRISMRCGSQVFLVEDGKWFSNFTYATFVDDPYGNFYLVVFAPPDGNFTVKSLTAVNMSIVVFEPQDGEVASSNVGKVSGTEIYFEVENSSVKPESITSKPPEEVPQQPEEAPPGPEEEAQPGFRLEFVALIAVAVAAVLILAVRKRKK
ncbi:MAG: hypothetical protein ACTSYM_05590 [Candidatus Baldrarchaeia archaeon]